MKTSVIAATAIVVLLIAGTATATFASSQIRGGDSNTTTSTTTQTTHHDSESENGQNHEGGGGLNLAVGQVLKFSGLSGHFNNLTRESSEGDEDHNSMAGNATGTFTFRVTSASAGGATLTITSGSFTLDKKTYTVTSGTVTLHEGDRSGNGTGTASGGATFAIRVSGIHGNLTTTIFDGHFKLDVKIGTSEYHVLLGTPEVSDDSSEE